jgi:hypothetical protein
VRVEIAGSDELGGWLKSQAKLSTEISAPCPSFGAWEDEDSFVLLALATAILAHQNRFYAFMRLWREPIGEAT